MENFELEYDSIFEVYKILLGDEVILTGTDDLSEAKKYAENLIQNGE